MSRMVLPERGDECEIVVEKRRANGYYLPSGSTVWVRKRIDLNNIVVSSLWKNIDPAVKPRSVTFRCRASMLRIKAKQLKMKM
jgi:hypothetical protein